MPCVIEFTHKTEIAIFSIINLFIVTVGDHSIKALVRIELKCKRLLVCMLPMS